VHIVGISAKEVMHQLSFKQGKDYLTTQYNTKWQSAAEMLISERSLNIADIAQRLGYDNASKFSAAFRDVMGVTPQNYRSRQEEM
jgi:AraC-like DNA-binding protein